MAKQTGGKAANQRSKDQSRAAALKAKGETRRTGRCCVCNRIIRLPTYNHIASGCKGG